VPGAQYVYSAHGALVASSDLGRGESRSASPGPEGLTLARDDVRLLAVRPPEEPATTALSGACPGRAELRHEIALVVRPPKTTRAGTRLN
jgi:hypothetical protein